MFSRSATAFVVLASVELLVLLLAVGYFGVLLLLAVVAALVAFGTVPVFGQFTVLQRFTVLRRFAVGNPVEGGFSRNFAPLPVQFATPSSSQIDHRSPRHVANISSLFLTPTGPESNPPAAARALR